MITFIGHVSKDINVIHGKEETAYGGGVVAGSITAALLGVKAKVVTKCAREDIVHFEFYVKTELKWSFWKVPGQPA